MKSVLTTILCVALTLALVTGAVGIGAVRGWSSEREAALNTLSVDGDMGEALQNLDADVAMGLGDEILPLVRTSLDTAEVKALVKTGLIVEIDTVQLAKLLAKNVLIAVVEAE